jgi:hypothetical protein
LTTLTEQDSSAGVEAEAPPSMSAQWISLWMTPVAGLILLVAFVSFPGFRPPMSPSMPAADVAAFFARNTTGTRLSMIIFDLCGIMLLPFFMLIVLQMKRMGTPTQVFAYCYLSAVVSGATFFAISNLLWLLAAFRPERDPALIQLLNDLAWIIFTAPVGMLVGQCVALALAIYLDARAQPVFPRWVGHLNIATAVVLVPAACAAVVTSGPLAWDGVVSFWLKLSAFSFYLVVMFFVVRAALQRQARDEGVPA